jgi:excisionase family DNA binding protein
MKEAYTTTKLQERLLRAVEVAEILSISRAFAYQLMQQGKIRTVIIDRARRVRPEDLRTFIEKNLSPQITREFMEQ